MSVFFTSARVPKPCRRGAAAFLADPPRILPRGTSIAETGNDAWGPVAGTGDAENPIDAARFAMMRKTLVSLAALTGLALAAPAFAIPSTPAGYMDDAGDELFVPASNVVGVELFDLFGAFSEFGFYFADDPGTLISIFDAGDDLGLSSATAFIDFDNGFVFDVDAGVIQDLFTTSGAAIGFWLTVGSLTIHSEAALNAAGTDLGFAFQSMSDPMDWLIGFDGFGGGTIALEFFSGLSSVTVSEPATVALIGFGMLAMGLARRRRR